MTKYITEILEEINNDIALLLKYKDNYAIRTILEYAFDPEKKFVLPEGAPPYRPASEPLGMTPSNFYQQIKKLYVFTRKDLNPLRRETLFVQLCEAVHPTEAAICLAIKDQRLTEMYCNITRTAVEEAGIVKPFRIEADADELTSDTESTIKASGRKLELKLDDAVNIEEQLGGKAPAEKAAVVPPVKRKAGRPKKVVSDSEKAPVVKRKAGRPAKAKPKETK